jgi:AraC family transcriptional regulator
VIPRHAHAAALFGMVLEGGYRAYYDNRCRECSPSLLMFHPAGEVHSETHYDVVVRILSIGPREGLLAHIGEHARVLDGPQELRGGPVLRLAARLYEEFRSHDPLAPLAMEGLALELLACILRKWNKTSRCWARSPKCWTRPMAATVSFISPQEISPEVIA